MAVAQLCVVGLPRLSDSMEEGTVVEWLVRDGAQVVRGQPIVEIETDKATMPYEADAAGWVKILIQAGETVAVGAPIAEIHPTAESARDGAPGAHEGEVGGPLPDTPACRPATPPGGISPVARRVAERLGIDLADVKGSGPRGRILKADLAATPAGSPPERDEPDAAPPDTGPLETVVAPPVQAAAVAHLSTAKGDVERIEPSRLQQIVARRMAEAKATAPEFAMTMDIEMTAAIELRARLKELGDGAPSVNDLIVKACALALAEHRDINAAYRDGEFQRYGRINIGIAVALEDALVVPTIFDADRLSLGALARECRRLASSARDGSITPPELSGATFTVSNLGMYGVTSFVAVLNPPQAAILSVGAIRRLPAFDEHDNVVAAHTMTATLTSDHRIVYGAHAAAFLGTLRRLLETPMQLVL
jgi:pyruvate dehydrogenase E2 component (dihydrolipoamide acetyltransferase)